MRQYEPQEHRKYIEKLVVVHTEVLETVLDLVRW